MNPIMNNVNSPAYYQQQPQQVNPQQQIPLAPAQQQIMAPGMGPTSVANPNLATNLMGATSAASNSPGHSSIPGQQISFQANSDNDNLVDPILKCKELFNQLRMSLQYLLTQLSNVLTPPNENRNQTENQFQNLGKAVENFNRVCDLMIVNLRTAYEAQTISTDLRSFLKFVAFDQTQFQQRYNFNDATSIGYQMQRISDFRSMLQKFVNGNGSGS